MYFLEYFSINPVCNFLIYEKEAIKPNNSFLLIVLNHDYESYELKTI